MSESIQVPDVKKEYLWIVEDILKEAAKENINRFFGKTIQDVAKDCYQEEISEDTIAKILNYYEHLGYLKMKILYNPHYPNPKTEIIVDTIGDLPREAPLDQCYPVYFLNSDFVKHQQKIAEKEQDENTEQKFNFKTEMQPVRYIQLGKNWYKCEDVLLAISDILDTEEDASIWGDCIKEYGLLAPLDIYTYLVHIGLVKKQTGERMSALYCMAKGAEEKLKEMQDEIQKYIEQK